MDGSRNKLYVYRISDFARNEIIGCGGCVDGGCVSSVGSGDRALHSEEINTRAVAGPP